MQIIPREPYHTVTVVTGERSTFSNFIQFLSPSYLIPTYFSPFMLPLHKWSNLSLTLNNMVSHLYKHCEIDHRGSSYIIFGLQSICLVIIYWQIKTSQANLALIKWPRASSLTLNENGVTLSIEMLGISRPIVLILLAH